MKTKIIDNGNHVDMVSLNPITDEVETRTFHRPCNGGYITVGRDYRQVCVGLGSMGSTLYCDENESLAEIIRKNRRIELRHYSREGIIQ